MTKFQKVTSALLVGATLSLAAVSAASAADKMIFFRIGTGGAGGTYFPIGGAIANAISLLTNTLHSSRTIHDITLPIFNRESLSSFGYGGITSSNESESIISLLRLLR